jgi:hypothetical protein
MTHILILYCIVSKYAVLHFPLNTVNDTQLLQLIPHPQWVFHWHSVLCLLLERFSSAYCTIFNFNNTVKQFCLLKQMPAFHLHQCRWQKHGHMMQNVITDKSDNKQQQTHVSHVFHHLGNWIILSRMTY